MATASSEVRNSSTTPKQGTMKAVQFARAGAQLEQVTRDIPQPKRGEVRIRVQACGICHSDSLPQLGIFPGQKYPVVPGHEVVGIVDELGEGVTEWHAGQRVGVGWHGGHDFTCDACRRGDFVMCKNELIPGINMDGGYAEYMIARRESLAAVPEELNSAEAGPLLCAGITTFNALRNAGARPGDTVAVLGIGGLGHLAVQYAAKMGFRTVAIARGQDKARFSRDLGAHHYIDSKSEDVAKALTALGGAKVIISTVTNSDAMSATIDGLGNNGELMVIGADVSPLKASPLQLIPGRKRIAGWASGSAIDSEDTLKFSALTGVRPMIERYPLERAQEAFDRMMSGEARFRVVLEVN
jgi:D-arabinose 1-dehydrogenase-like Zn-dependent alcohol dehydrogenase